MFDFIATIIHSITSLFSGEAFAANPPPVINRNTKSKETSKIVGLKSPSIIKTSTGNMTVLKEDVTTYPDKAILQYQNISGSNSTITGISIRGMPVRRMAGNNGYVWEYSDYDSIEKNGELTCDISNDYLVDPVQCKTVGDFAWKELQPHKMYVLTLNGCHYQYEIGDVHTLTIDYSLNGGQIENINTDVEVYAVSHSREIGGIGTTVLSVRVTPEAWSLTMSKNAILTGAGKAQWLGNRSNVITVASSTYTGQADYYCDGTDDDIEIQAAIDYLDLIGGGTIYLTYGNYYCTSTITVKSNIIISGAGKSTVLYFAISTVGGNIYFINIAGYDNIIIDKMSIDGSSDTFTHDGSVYAIYNNDPSKNISLRNIIVSNITVASSRAATGIYYIHTLKDVIVYDINTYNASCYGIQNCFYALSVLVYNLTNATSNGSIAGFVNSVHLMLCEVYNIGDSSGGTGFSYCGYINSCYSHDNYFGFQNCHVVHGCRTGSNISSNYGLSTAGLAANPCDDTAGGGYNS